MQFEWVTELSAEQYQKLEEFYFGVPIVHIEQFPDWNNVSRMNVPVCYCLAMNGNVLQGYAMVYEYKKVFAEIKFGPLSISADVSVEIILEIVRYYKAKGFLNLQVVLGMEAGSDASFIQYSLYIKKRFKWYLDKYNKATLLLRLDDKTDEQLFKHFSEHHRRAIRKANKSNLTCRNLSSIQEVEQFAKGYNKMYQRRNIRRYSDKNIESFISIYKWLKASNKGFFMGVFEKEMMIGGMLILFRKDTAEYYAGFTLPDERKLPIGHFAFFEIMKQVRLMDISYFDFGGYNILVDKKDQVFQINKFKKGFHPDHFIYPPRMYFDLKPMGSFIVRNLKRLKDFIIKN
jgi:hypothetical protein